ncbi:transglutaminase-like domain-containing protein [Amycolatopsis minnesotensis]|uniref:Transglutaminase-like domain-containing protein n=1 Tax=Amycolatopsis minnesotensis TaxID=337894 RepID=A0ABN2R3R6_9PSEU
MRDRIGTGCLLLATALPGLLFAPVFGFAALVPSILAVLVLCGLVAELCLRVPSLRPWRPVLALLLGLLGIAEVELGSTTAGGIPTADTVRGLVSGVTGSWQLTLQSTWPALPDPQLMLFVPLAVLFAAVLGLELARWSLAALLPSLVVLGLSQAYVAVTGPTALLVALAYAGVAGTLLAVSRPRPAIPSGAARRGAAALLVLPTAFLGVAAAVAATVAVPVRADALSLHQNESVPLPPTRVVNPLDEVAARLRTPAVPVFGYTATARVDRWRVAVLDDFDGARWTSTAEYRRMGATVAPPPGLTARTDTRQADVTVEDGEDLPWVPSQAVPSAVTGVAPLIDERSGMLMVPGAKGPAAYHLSWREPEVNADDLAGAAIDPAALAGRGLGAAPPEIADLARAAVAGQPPSFRAALVLERYLSQHYQLATGAALPTGNGWQQLRTFLLETRRGTSEQFAASYVALARLLGIPARLAVGYRAPASVPGRPVVVRDGDVFAWPEVAVSGIGWVSLDPTGGAGGSGTASDGLAKATAQVRAELPPPQDLRVPPLKPEPGGAAPREEQPGTPFPYLAAVLVLFGLAVLVLAAVPVAKAIRSRRRRRATGQRAVVAAWWEATDLLRAHGVPFTEGMTVRDLAAAAGPFTEQSVVDGLRWLAHQVDTALWSGRVADDGTGVQAWASVRAIRGGLARLPWQRRLRALFDPRPLFPPAGPDGRWRRRVRLARPAITRLKALRPSRAVSR